VKSESRLRELRADLMLDIGTEIVLACIFVLYSVIQIICWHRLTFYTSLAPPLFIYYGNWLDLGQIRRPGLIGRHVILCIVRFYSIGRAYRCTSGVGFTWWFQGCWNGHKFHWKIIYSLGLPNEVLANAQALYTQWADSWTVGNTVYVVLVYPHNLIIYKGKVVPVLN
jgi:hypothetical protein